CYPSSASWADRRPCSSPSCLCKIQRPGGRHVEERRETCPSGLLLHPLAQLSGIMSREVAPPPSLGCLTLPAQHRGQLEPMIAAPVARSLGSPLAATGVRPGGDTWSSLVVISHPHT